MPEVPRDQTKAVIADVFGRAAVTYGQRGGSYFNLFGRRLVEHTQLAAGMRVIDIATGRGAALFPAAQAVGATGYVTGIDLTEPMVVATRAEIAERGITNAEARVMDAEHLDFGSETFDAGLCGFALFFMPDPPSALIEFRRVLRPGGRLGLSTWGRDDGRWQWYDDLLSRYAPAAARLRLHTADALDQADKVAGAVVQSGYRILHVIEETVTYGYASPDEWWDARWSHFGRARLESMPETTLSAFQADVFTQLARMQTEGELVSDMAVVYAVAQKV